MLKKLRPTAVGILVFLGCFVLFSTFNLGWEYVSLGWLVCICLAGLTVGWRAKEDAVYNAILFLFFSAPITIGLLWLLAISLTVFPASEAPSLRRMLLITLSVIPFAFLGEKLYWRFHK